MKITTSALLLVVASVATSANANMDATARNGTQELQGQQSCLNPEFHVDYPGNDFVNYPAKSYQDCCDMCSSVRECGAYTWTSYQGGTCWYKSFRARSAWVGANSDGSAHTISAIMYRCAPLVKDQDLVGIDQTSVRAERPEECCQVCLMSQRGWCNSWSWTDYNGGTCWIKRGELKAVFKLGAYSPRL